MKRMIVAVAVVLLSCTASEARRHHHHLVHRPKIVKKSRVPAPPVRPKTPEPIWRDQVEWYAGPSSFRKMLVATGQQTLVTKISRPPEVVGTRKENGSSLAWFGLALICIIGAIAMFKVSLRDVRY